MNLGRSLDQSWTVHKHSSPNSTEKWNTQNPYNF
jgi:hypothetical protein